MRVISGKCKGRVLYSPQSESIRPTSNKIKEFIFNFIGNAIYNAVVLDLFSGTGNLSVEALSRGAKKSVLVDNSKEAILLIYRNLELTNFLPQCKIVQQDVFRYLKVAVKKKYYFNFIFADPPYSIIDYYLLIKYVGDGNLLKDGGFFILEHSSRAKLDESFSSMTRENTKIFGDTGITFYSNKGI